MSNDNGGESNPNIARLDELAEVDNGPIASWYRILRERYTLVGGDVEEQVRFGCCVAGFAAYL